MLTHVRFISLLAFVSAPLLAGCFDPADGGGSADGDATSGAGGAGNASAGGSAPGGQGGAPAVGGAGGARCGVECALGGAGGEAEGGRGEGGAGEGGGSEGGAGGVGGAGTGTDTGTGSDTGTGTDTGTGSDTGTGTDTGTGSGGAGGGGAGGSGPVAPVSDVCPGISRQMQPGDSVVIRGTTEGHADDYGAFCADTTPQADMADAFYSFSVDEAVTFKLSVQPAPGSPLDPGVYLLEDCGTLAWCADFGLGETVKMHREAGRVTVVVDSRVAIPGEFELSLEVSRPVCGDSVVNPGEACDPGAAAPADGCHDPGTADECQVEAGAVEMDVCPGEFVSVPAGTMMLTRDDGHTTVGYTDDYESNVCGAYFGLERVYELVPEVDGTMTVTVGLDEQGNAICAEDVGDLGCWDQVMYVRTDCADSQTELGCSDQWWDTPEFMTFPVVAGTPYYVFVDGYDDQTWSQGPYNLHIELH